MKTVFGILWRDVKLLLRNPVALVVVLALLVLPGLYAWYCILANWDPYANTGRVPVVVVNEDRGATSELTGSVDIGAQVVEELEENDDIDWHFTDDKDRALEGVRTGEYYAALVLPDTLSEDIVGIFSASKAEPTIYYYPNEKFNAVATKVTDSAATSLIRKVNQAFSSQVNETVLEKVQQGADSAEDAAQRAYGNTMTEASRAQAEIDAVVASLDDADESIRSWRAAVAGNQDTLEAASGQMPALRTALAQASDGLDTLRQNTENFNGTFGTALLQSNQLLSGLSARTSTRVATAGADVRQLAGSVSGVVEQLRGFRAMAEEIAGIVSDESLKKELFDLVDEVDTTLAKLEDAGNGLAAAAEDASEKAEQVDGTVQQATEDATAASGTFSTQILPQLSGGTSGLASALTGLLAAIGQFESQVGQLEDVLSQADDALARSLDAIAQAKVLLSGVSADLGGTVADLGALGSALEVESIAQLLDVSPGNVGQFVSSPVNMVTEKVYPVSNYGTAVAPFYTNLALWIGCFILISIIRLEVDRRGFEGATTTQRYFGRWLLLVVLALLQSQVICGVDIALGIDCANPALFMLSGAVASFCYMNLIYALSISFRNIGKTLCIVLLIMQVPGSSGMYPIEMMPSFFQSIHPFLPFTYGIDAMREALCGLYGHVIAGDWLVLSSLVPAALLLGLVLRPNLLNLTQLFDEELGKAGFFAAEQHGQGLDNDGIRNLMRAVSRYEAYRDDFEQRAWRFSSRYPRLRRVGSIALFAVPFAFLLVMLPFNLTQDMTTDVKLVSLAIILVLLFAIQVGLIVLEYVHRAIAEETRLLGIELLGDYETMFDQVDDVRQEVEQRAGEVREEVREEAASALAALAPGVAAAAESLEQRVGGARDRRRRHGAVREIFFTDMRLGFQSIIGVVVIMLLVITPSLYAWFNIAGSWDPYSKTDGLRVAVANLDEGYKCDLLPLTVNVGDTVVSQLRGNSSFDWQFVGEDEAVEGIEAGEYYASIVIPANFSKNMMTYLVDGAEYPDVVYYTNEKENPIAPLITQKGADSIQENIRITFTERVDEAGLTMAADLLEYLSQPRVDSYASKMGGHLDDATSDMVKGAAEMRSLADLAGIVSGVVLAAGSAMDGIQAAAGTGKEALDQAESSLKDTGAAFKQATALVEGLVAQNSGGFGTLVDDADTALAALQGGMADAPQKVRTVQERVTAWKGQVERLYEVFAEQAQEASLDDETRADAQRIADKLEPVATALGKMEAALEKAAGDADGSTANIAQAREELRELEAGATSGMEDVRAYYNDDVKDAAANLKESVETVSSTTRDILKGLDETVDGLAGSTDGLSGRLTSLAGTLTGGAQRLDAVAGNISGIKSRVEKALESDDVNLMQDLLLGNDTTVLAARLAAPVQQKEEAIFPVANYGSSMAPFYTVLSLWVGALVMVSTMKVHLTPERVEELSRRFRLRPGQEYLGRLGVFAFVALLQSLLVCLGDLCLLHIQCVHPVLFVLFGVFIGQVFCLIVYTFAELFGDVGKAVCIILLIMQVAASGGTFPVEMLGDHFILIVPFLPFYHGMTALQGCVAGMYNGDAFVYLAVLLVFVAGMLLMGLVARRPFRFVTNWVEEQLEKTHYM